MDDPVRLTFDRILSILALLFGVISLLLSCHANNLANDANLITAEQARANLVLLDATSEDLGVFGDPLSVERYSGCKINLRIANTGGAATSIIRHDSFFDFSGAQKTVSSSTGKIEYHRTDVAPGVFLVGLVLSKNANQTSYTGPIFANEPDIILQELESDLLSLPLRIEAYTTMDILVIANFRFDGTRYAHIADFRAVDNADEVHDAFKPVTIHFTFKTDTRADLKVHDLIHECSMLTDLPSDVPAPGEQPPDLDLLPTATSASGLLAPPLFPTATRQPGFEIPPPPFPTATGQINSEDPGFEMPTIPTPEPFPTATYVREFGSLPRKRLVPPIPHP